MSRRRRVQFCGAITGSVVLRPGETEEAALERAEALVLRALDRGAARLRLNVGLEQDDGPE